MRYVTLVAAALAVSWLDHAKAQDAVDQCRTVADVMGRDESREQYDLKLLDTVYTQTCSGKSTKANLDFSSSATTMVDFVPVTSGFKFGGRKEKAEHICSTYDATKTVNLYRSGATSTVVREAIEAWKQCVVANKDVYIRIKPTVSAGTFFFELKRGAEDAIFNGVKLKEGQLTCTATLPDTNGINADRIVDENTHVRLTSSSVNVACSRGIVEDNGLAYMPQTSFLIDTTRGSVPVVLPRDARFGPLYGSELMRHMQDAQQANQQWLERLQNRKTEYLRQCSSIGSMCGGGPAAPACPSGWAHAMTDSFSYNGGSCGLGANCSICTRLVDSPQG